MAVTPLVLAGALVPLAYGFGADTKLTYDVNVQFDGFLPLFDGMEGKVEVKMGVGVVGQEPTPTSLKASSEIREFELRFNGEKFPLGVGNVIEYFPKTTIELEPQGKILKTDAPNKTLPVKLPGLDVKHFPDITYVPIELPADGVEEGKSWTFVRDFGGAPLNYSCKAESVKDGKWHIQVKLDQKFVVNENSSMEVVTKPEDAVSEVTTTMTGEGYVEFDSGAGRVESAEVTNKAVSEAKDLKSGETKTRKLTTKFSIKLRAGGASRAVARPVASQGWWEDTMAWGSRALNVGRGALAWVQTASIFGLRSLPTELEAWIRPFRASLRRWLPIR